MHPELVCKVDNKQTGDSNYFKLIGASLTNQKLDSKINRHRVYYVCKKAISGFLAEKNKALYYTIDKCRIQIQNSFMPCRQEQEWNLEKKRRSKTLWM